jgi:hypothetical protein
MRIDFECSGGFAALQLAYHSDTDELPTEVAEEISRLVESSGFFDLQQGEVTPMPDVISYRLSLSQGDKKKSLSFNDITAPVELRPLLALLRKLAMEQRLSGG